MARYGQVKIAYSVFDLFVDKTTEGTEPTETFSSVISVVTTATYFSKALYRDRNRFDRRLTVVAPVGLA